jgi:2-aminoadipate transaminase
MKRCTTLFRRSIIPLTGPACFAKFHFPAANSRTLRERKKPVSSGRPESRPKIFPGAAMPFESLLADRTRLMSANAIREILKVVAKPGMISLAGGIPSPDSFPMDIIRELEDRTLRKYGSSAFQYDRTEGFMPLCEALSVWLQRKGILADSDSIRITSGSQGALLQLGMILLSKGDAVAVEAPTYLGALTAFNPFEPRYLRVDTDGDGMVPEALDRLLERERVKFVYLIPNFQNPTGRTLSEERRKVLAEILVRRDALLVEDDPYGDLRYRGRPLPTVKSLAPDHVVYCGSLSKIFAPGLRIGYVVAPEPIRRWMVLAKQGIDLHTSTLTQALAAEYISGGFLDKHLPEILAIYRPKQEAMLQALDRHMPKTCRWTRPDGGMFIWVEGPAGLDTEKLYHKAVEHGVAFVPGKFFFTEPGEGIETMRLNYTMSDASTLEKAVRLLAGVLTD